MLALLTFAAAEGEEPSKTLFYVLGPLLAVAAVAVSVVGFNSPDFPGSRGGVRAMMAVFALLVVGALSAAVITS